MSIEKATAYISSIASGTIPACRYIRLAIDRHLSELQRQNTPGFPYHFSEAEAERILNLYSFFRFSKGSVAGEPFDLMPWFAALVYIAFGWRRDGGGKRFRKVYCKVARGNAKTANLVAIGTIGFLFDNVSDPEVVWVATKKDQAKIGWERQRSMLEMLVRDEPELGPLLNIPKGHTSTRINRKDCLSWVTYLGRDSSGEDGSSPSLAIVDEYHAWDNDDMMNVIESGMVKVPDPVTWIITTAGYKPQGPNSSFLKACKNVLDGVVENEELLAFIYELDENDDWKDETVWYKANPGIGISVTLEALRTEYNKIKSQGLQKEIDFKVKNLNMEASGERGWIADDVWMKGDVPVTLDDLKDRVVYGGLDLANTNDFNAFVLFAPPRFEGDPALALPYYWITEDAVEKFGTKRPFVKHWVQQGHITTTPGNVTDYEQIRREINGICKDMTALRAIGFDRALSHYLTPALMDDGFRMEVLIQSWQWLTPAAKYLEVVAAGQNFHHNGNPVLRWNMANVTMQFDRNENYLPHKGKSADKIDGVAALLNAIAQWLKERGEGPTTYYWEEEGGLLML